MRKWIIGFLFALFLSCIFLPQIASTSLGKPFFIKALSLKTQSKIKADALSFSWFGPQKFHRINWSRDNTYGTVEELEIKAPFWSFSGPFHLKNGTVDYEGTKISAINGQIEGNEFDLHAISSEGPVSLKGSVKPDAHFDLTLDAPNIKAKLKGKQVANGLTLDEPVIATLYLTPRIATVLLKDINPLFLNSISAQNPAILQIEPNDFLFPLPYSFEKLKVGKATLDLGKVKCQTGPSLESILSLFKVNAKEMDIWFTPVSFSIQGGSLKTNRMDFLIADSIHLCTWGKIDLIKDRLKMTLGIPSDTLRKSFGIKHLPENYVLKMDVRGTTKQPDIATGSASAKIAAMLASKQLPKKGILGGLAEIFTTPQDDGDTPPPQKPFPWSRN